MARLGYHLIGMGIVWSLAMPGWAKEYSTGGASPGYGTFTLSGQEYQYLRSALGISGLASKTSRDELANGGLIQGFAYGVTGSLDYILDGYAFGMAFPLGVGYGIQWLEPTNTSAGIQEGFGARVMVEGIPTMLVSSTSASSEADWTWSAGGAITLEQMKYKEKMTAYTGLFATARLDPFGEIPGRSIVFGINFIDSSD